MGIKANNEAPSGFEKPEKGTYLFRIGKFEFREEPNRGREDGSPFCPWSVRVSGVTIIDAEVHEQYIGQKVPDNFINLYIDFRLEDFLALAIKAIDLPDIEYEHSFLDDAGFRMKVEKKSEGAVFGGDIWYQKDRNDANKEWVRIGRPYLTEKEFRVLKAASGDGQPKQETAPASTGTGSGW